MDNEERIIKAIKFFREFKSKSDSEIYRKAVLRFCDLVEIQYLPKKAEITAKDVENAMF